MWRTRRTLIVVVLVVAAVIVGASRYIDREPNPVLATTPVGSGGFLAVIDPWRARFYIHSDALYVVDTRTGKELFPSDVVEQLPGPVINHLVPHLYMDVTPDSGQTELDDRTFTQLHQVILDNSTTFWFLDEPSDRFYVGNDDYSIHALDGATGRQMRIANTCQVGSPNAVESHPEEHLFLPCADGSTQMHDARTGRLLRSIATTKLGDCSCRRIVDDRTGRVFIPGANALGVLDAHTGAFIRTLPFGVWPGAAFELDSHAGGAIEQDPHTGNMFAAPYVPPGTGATASHNLLVLDGRTGAILRRWDVPANPTALLVNPVTDHLLVTSAGPVDSLGEPLGNGVLSVLDSNSGATIKRIDLGILPGDLFADQNTGHLVVVNFSTDMSGNALLRTYSDGWWNQMQRGLKGAMNWLPFTAPAAPSPPVDDTVMLLDLKTL
jgi:hypothetical protein